ncbi:hypothetical protein [Paenibacillus sonchi]|uniref:hypothetical protein n=1 Tax=Paenibacillus sonchi TaxID=373687 RepID=UPI001F2A09E2|nr:hypothetical protein [Paenibacillus sonchi]
MQRTGRMTPFCAPSLTILLLLPEETEYAVSFKKGLLPQRIRPTLKGKYTHTMTQEEEQPEQ